MTALKAEHVSGLRVCTGSKGTAGCGKPKRVRRVYLMCTSHQGMPHFRATPHTGPLDGCVPAPERLNRPDSRSTSSSGAYGAGNSAAISTAGNEASHVTRNTGHVELNPQKTTSWNSTSLKRFELASRTRGFDCHAADHVGREAEHQASTWELTTFLGA